MRHDILALVLLLIATLAAVTVIFIIRHGLKDARKRPARKLLNGNIAFKN